MIDKKKINSVSSNANSDDDFDDRENEYPHILVPNKDEDIEIDM